MAIAIYNEINTYCVDWLRNLVNADLITQGHVNPNSIVDLDPKSLEIYTQAHFFAGIGVWSHALKYMGWPDTVPVWTGSCPCQPFSNSGKQLGFADARHLWPTWYSLIQLYNPAIIFGEQVASPEGLVWLDLVFTDLERQGYSCAAANLSASSVGAPHLRSRLFFVAYAAGKRCDRLDTYLCEWRAHKNSAEIARRGPSGGPRVIAPPRGEVDFKPMGYSDGHAAKHGYNVDPEISGSQSLSRDIANSNGSGNASGITTGLAGFWDPCDWILCRDGKARPLEPGINPLAHGPTARLEQLRAYGNAIVGPLAVEFIESALEAIEANLLA